MEETLEAPARLGAYCIIEEDVRFGPGCEVWHYAQIRPRCRLGAGVSVGSGAHLGPGVRIGDGTRIGAYAQIHHPARVGARVFVGPNAFLGNDRYPEVGAVWEPQPVVIADDAVIGAGALICGGVTIGAGAIVGMGAVVIRDVPAGEIVAGNPAHAIGRRLQCYPGTAVEHWGPVQPCARCPRCDGYGVEQYVEWCELMAARRTGYCVTDFCDAQNQVGAHGNVG